jgi:hypothetical protein
LQLAPAHRHLAPISVSIKLHIPALKADRNAALQAAAEAHAEIEKAVANATNAKDLSYCSLHHGRLAGFARTDQ